MNDKNYVLQATNNKGEVRYYSIDHSSGGYSYWTPYFQDAKHDTYDNLMKVMVEMATCTGSNRDLQCAGGFNNAYPSGTVDLDICRIELESAAKYHIKYDMRRE